MGAYSTILITESKAKKYIFDKLLSADNTLLEELMDKFLSDRLYNVRIVDDSEENDDSLL